MPRLPVLAFLLVMAAALAGASCGDDNTTTPTSPTPVYVTDTFSGTVEINGTARHTFAAKTPGSIVIALTTLAPDSTLQMGIGLGTWDGTACAIVLQTGSASQSSQFSASTTSAGNYCVTIFDVGNLTSSADYAISVTHP